MRKKDLYIKAANGNIIFPDMKNVTDFFNIKAKPMIEEAIENYHSKVEEVKQDATKEALILLLPIVCTSLYESYGFGEKRLQKFIEYFLIHMECINNGVTDLQQYKDFCKDQNWRFFDMVEVKNENI